MEVFYNVQCYNIKENGYLLIILRIEMNDSEMKKEKDSSLDNISQ